VEYLIGIVPTEGYLQRVSEFQRRWPANRLVHIVEPHVTIKAQAGLTEDLGWLQQVQAVCTATRPFELAFGEPGWFGEQVLFLSVQSEMFYPLHHALVERVNPSEELRKRYYEGDEFHAHLTLGIAGQGVTVMELQEMERLANVELLPAPRFQVEFLRVYQYDGSPEGGYRKMMDIPLGG
jgi:2'-5' RNA ligase